MPDGRKASAMAEDDRRGRTRALRVLGCIAVVTTTASCSGAVASQPSSVGDSFDGPNGVIVSERTAGPAESLWEVTSGTLFRRDGTGWTGPPDDGSTSEGNGSAVFRMTSGRRSFADVDVTLRLRVDGLVETPRTPAQDYDGAHIWVRYGSRSQLYAASVDRRDGTMIVKKKCPGGDVNGGTYYDLGPPVGDVPVPYDRWQRISVSARDLPDGSVAVIAERDGVRLDVVDSGVGCAPLRGAGAVGIRGDNAELSFDDITIDSSGSSPR